MQTFGFPVSLITSMRLTTGGSLSMDLLPLRQLAAWSALSHVSSYSKVKLRYYTVTLRKCGQPPWAYETV